ncbi:MAG: hypothetical protein WAU88_02550 [Candidatus Zixiibacteriota bacterium]
MSDDALFLLMQSFGLHILSEESDPRGIVGMLMTETTRFRDKLKGETGAILTVEDTRIALDALEQYLTKNELPYKLTSEQRALAQIFVDRVTMFRRR